MAPPETIVTVPVREAASSALLPPHKAGPVSAESVLDALQTSADRGANYLDKNGQLRLRISQVPRNVESTTPTKEIDSYVFDKSATSGGEIPTAGKLKKFIPSAEKSSKKTDNWVEVEKDTPRFYIVKSKDENTLYLTDANARLIGEVKIEGGNEVLVKLRNNDLFIASAKLNYITQQGTLVEFTIDGSNFSLQGNGKNIRAIIINGLPPSEKPLLNTKDIKADPLAPLAEHQEQPNPRDQKSTAITPDLAGAARHIVTDLGIKRSPFSMPVGDYHLPSPEQREKSTLRGIAILAENNLPADKLQKLYEKYEVSTFKKDGERIDRIRGLYNETVGAVNLEVSKNANLEVASDRLRAMLGLPQGVQVLLARSGNLDSMSESQLDEVIIKTFRDNIVLRKIGDGAFADPDDIIIIQVHKQNNRSLHSLNMSHIQGTALSRDNWQVTSYEATYRSNPSPYIKDEIRRSSEKTEYSFSQWLETRESWTALSNNGKILDGALRKKEELCLQRDKAIIAGREKEKESISIAASQVDEQAEFKRIREGYYVTSYRGRTVSYQDRSNATIGARNFRTGLIDFRATAGIEFTIEDAVANGNTTIRVDSYAQIKASSEKSKEFIRHILTTPYENSPEESIRKIISLFPGQVYRPNELVALFSPPRYYVRELKEEVAKIYPSNGSHKEQRAFLEKLLSELQKNEKITEKSITKIISALRGE